MRLSKLFPAMLTVILLCIFSSVFTYAADVIDAPGGTVTNAEEFVAALGGTDAASVSDDTIILISDIKLTSPLVIAEGSYIINGAGCYIYRGAFDGDMITAGTGESAVSLTLGISTASSDTEALVLTASEESAFSGTLLKVSSGSSASMYIGTVFRNASSDTNGAAIVNDGDFRIYDGFIENCTSAGCGGAIYNTGNFAVSTCIITGCSATDGGAIYNTGTFNIYNLTVSGNIAEKGGAVYNEGTFTQNGGTLSENSASFSGGAIYNPGTAALKGGTVEKNHSAGVGGAVYNGGSLNIAGTYVNENTSVSHGAGIYNDGTLSLSDGYVYAGTSGTNGGGFYNSATGTISVSGGTIGQNTAVYGGGIFNLGTLNVTGGGFNNNTAEAGYAILNDGILNFSEYPYISDKNDVFIVASDDNRHAVQIKTPLAANKIAVLTPGISDGTSYRPEYKKGTVLIAGEYAGEEYHRFSVTADEKSEWSVDEKGALKKDNPVYLQVWFYAALAGAFAVTVGLMVLFIKSDPVNRMKKVSGAKAESKNNDSRAI